MRNKYSQEFEDEMRQIASENELEKLFWIAREKYNYSITKNQLRQYLYKRQIRYKDYNKKMSRNMGLNIPIGTEYTKDDGMVLVKVAKNKWKYKQRLLYEKYHNVKLNSDDYIIFLDQDRTNFDINNLKRITKHESSVLSNQYLFSKQKDVTETGIQIAKLIIKIKEEKLNGKIK